MRYAMNRPRRQQGLTLVELMIALTLGLIIIAAMIAVFVFNSQSYRQNEALGALQDSARFAMDSLSRDFAMAGYWGGVRPVDASDNVRVSAAATASGALSAGDCGATASIAVGVPMVFRNHTLDTDDVADDFACLLPADIQPNTDIVMIRRVSGEAAYSHDGSAATGALIANRFYVKTNQNIASLFRAGSSFDLASPADCPDATGISEVCKPDSNPVQIYAYTPQIYYVRKWLRVPPSISLPDGDGLPILCRRYLNDLVNPPLMQEDCLAEGVENLQIEWGIGTDAVGKDGSVERYTSTPTAAQLFEARAVRIHLLVGATAANVQASNDAKTYTLGDLAAFTPAAGVLRRSFTTTVQLKNFQP